MSGYTVIVDDKAADSTANNNDRWVDDMLDSALLLRPDYGMTDWTFRRRNCAILCPLLPLHLQTVCRLQDSSRQSNTHV